MHAIIYTKTTCPYCTRAKRLLEQHGITYDEKLIRVEGDAPTALNENQQIVTRDDLLAMAPNAKTVPQIWLDGLHIGGHDDLVRHLGKD